MSLNRECVVAWWRRRWRRVLVIAAIAAAVGVAYWTLLDQAVDNRQRDDRIAAEQDRLAAEQRVDTAEKVTEVCRKINELPAKVARFLDLSDRRRNLLNTTTTTADVDDLTPAERAEFAQINAEMAALVVDLGSPVECDIATFTTTTRRP